jgi:rubredoxin
MQHEIFAVMRGGQRLMVADRRSTRPTYKAFDLTPRERWEHTIAPNLKHAREVREAFIAWNTPSMVASALGYARVTRVIVKPLTEVVFARASNASGCEFEPEAAALPCPFCGGADIGFDDLPGCVYCRECGAHGPGATKGLSHEDGYRREAVARWTAAARSGEKVIVG